VSIVYLMIKEIEKLGETNQKPEHQVYSASTYITLQIYTLSRLQFFTVFQIQQYTFAVVDHDQ
jgi:hypothetical protein